MTELRSSVGTRSANRASQDLRLAASSPAANALAPGTRLLREWRGQTHHVTVVASGTGSCFDYAGVTYSSLTAIARVITGTAWSGPLFFGLRT